MKIITRYIASTIILSTLTVILVLVGIESFIDFIGQLSDIGKQDYSTFVAIQYVLMQLPSSLYRLFPMAGFIGCLIGLGRLASNSELIVMRASGYSKKNILGAVILASFLIIVVITSIGEIIAPSLEANADTLKNIAMHKQTGIIASTDYWVRNTQRIAYINKVISPSKISNITYFDFNQAHQLLQIGHADYATLNNNQWKLRNVTQSVFKKNRVVSTHFKQAPLNMPFNPTLSHQTQSVSTSATLQGLLHNIIYLKKSGLISNQFEFSLWQRLIQPITSLVLMCLAIPFIFGSLRDSSAGSRVMVGILVGFSFYMLNQFFGPITMIYQFPPILAAISPTLLFIIIYFMLISHVK